MSNFPLIHCNVIQISCVESASREVNRFEWLHVGRSGTILFVRSLHQFSSFWEVLCEHTRIEAKDIPKVRNFCPFEWSTNWTPELRYLCGENPEMCVKKDLSVTLQLSMNDQIYSNKVGFIFEFCASAFLWSHKIFLSWFILHDGWGGRNLEKDVDIVSIGGSFSL